MKWDNEQGTTLNHLIHLFVQYPYTQQSQQKSPSSFGKPSKKCLYGPQEHVKYETKLK